MASQNMAQLNKLDPIVATVAIPPILGAIAWLVVLAMTGISGSHPIWDLQPRNLAEAVAFRDAGGVVRRVAAGEDPNRPGEVRSGVIGRAPITLAPIVVAADIREAGMVQLLLDLGASPGADTWQLAWCTSDDPDARNLLSLHRPEGALEECAAP
jgi:hypothetical protein